MDTFKLFGFVLFGIANGILMDEECNVAVWPHPGDPKVIYKYVPNGCVDGVFSWAYPRESVHLQFANPSQQNMSACIRDEMLGNIFTIRDITHIVGMPMIIGQKESCTMKHRGPITLRIDAPDVLYYVASVKYRVKTY